MPRTRKDLHEFQAKKGVPFLIENRYSAALFLDMGLGKTVIGLTAILDLLNSFIISKVLIVAPLRVVRNVWDREAKKWDYLSELTFSKITGNLDERIEALNAPADIYLINFEQYKWLIDYCIGEPGKRKRKNGKPVLFPFDLVLIDELTKLKHVSSQRYKAHKRIVKQPGLMRWGFTGSPAARHLLDIFGQYFVLDGGKRLGTNFSNFRKKYFNQMDYMGYDWEIKKKGKKALIKKTRDMTLRMNAKDYIDMPDLIINDIELTFPPKLQEMYDELEKEMFLELDLGNLEALTASALSMKCHQFVQGAAYITDDENRRIGPDVWEKIHDIKLEAFNDIIEEANGKPVLGIVNFKHDTQRLQKKYKCPKFGSGTSADEEKKLLDDWIEGSLPLLTGHPASMGHGLDGLQMGGDIIALFAMSWNKEYIDQTVARLWRQGQVNPVIVNRLIILNTIDEVIRENLILKDKIESEYLDTLSKYERKKVSSKKGIKSDQVYRLENYRKKKYG